MGRTIKIFDTTLRDGEQSPGCSMNLNEKIEVARQLEALRVDIIEAGFAIASPGDAAAIAAIADTVKNSTICSLARSSEKDIDAAWNAIRKAESARIHTFIATSPVHMQYKLKMTPEQVIESVAHHVAYAKKYCSDVEFSAEDSTRSELDFLCRVFETAIRAGATTLNIPDTVGYMVPDEYAARVRYIREHTQGIENVVLSCHVPVSYTHLYREMLDPTIRWTDRLQSSSGDWSGNLCDFYFRAYNKICLDIKRHLRCRVGIELKTHQFTRH